MKVSIENGHELPQSVMVRLEGDVSQRHLLNGDPLNDSLGNDDFAKPILIDMSQVATLDSSGVNWLLSCNRRTRAAGGKLVLHSLSPIARNVIRVLNLHAVLNLAESERDAVKMSQGGIA